jgi:mannose-6-phosphate isomerase-like protein (cupin superfamily)
MSSVQVQIQRRDEAVMTEEYGCQFRRILPWQHSGPSDNGMGVAVVAAGSSTTPHAHAEFEHFFLVRGAGRVWVDGVAVEVSEGDVVVVSPHQLHYFDNTAGAQPMEVLCLWTMSAFGGAS